MREPFKDLEALIEELWQTHTIHGTFDSFTGSCRYKVINDDIVVTGTDEWAILLRSGLPAS